MVTRNGPEKNSQPDDDDEVERKNFHIKSYLLCQSLISFMNERLEFILLFLEHTTTEGRKFLSSTIYVLVIHETHTTTVSRKNVTY